MKISGHSCIRALLLMSSTLATVGASSVTFHNGVKEQRHLAPAATSAKRPRIVNGSNVHTGSNPDRYPYFALMQDNSLCGAVLVGKRFVLTAAHCVGFDNDFQVGITDVDGDVEDIGAANGRIHPDYVDDTLENDIAIYELNRDVDLPYIRLRQSPIRNDGTPLTVIGFGDKKYGGGRESDYLMRTSVDYMGKSKCQRQVCDITPDMLCTYESVTGPCYGDSGGPLFVEGSSPGEDELVGLVSYGSADGDVGVYARISNLYDWIVANMCEMNPAGAPEEIDCGNVDPNMGGGNDIELDDVDGLSTQNPSSSSSSSLSTEFDDDASEDDSDDDNGLSTQVPSSSSSSSSSTEFDDDASEDDSDDDNGLSTQVPSSSSSSSSSTESDDDASEDEFDDDNGPSTQNPSSSSSSSSSADFDDDAFNDDNRGSARREKNNLRLESQYASSSASRVAIPRSSTAFVTSTALLSLAVQYWL